MWARLTKCMCVRPLIAQVRDRRWEEKGQRQGTQPTLPAPPGSSTKLHANSKFELGLPVHCEGVGFKVKGQEIFYLLFYQLDLYPLNIYTDGIWALVLSVSLVPQMLGAGKHQEYHEFHIQGNQKFTHTTLNVQKRQLLIFFLITDLIFFPNSYSGVK